MNADVIAGLIVGLTQGWLIQPIVVFLFRESVTRISSKISKDTPFNLFFGSVIAGLGTSFFLVLVVLLKNFVTVWDHFKIGWLFGFMVGALSYTFLMKPRRSK